MKNKKKNPALPLILAITIFYYVFENWHETVRMLSVLFDSTPNYLRRYMAARPLDFVYPAALLLAVLLILIAVSRISRAAKSTEGSLTKKKDHTHDRTDAVAFDRSETQNEHYIKQLNGFLKAGIIDKAEYNQLIRRYK